MSIVKYNTSNIAKFLEDVDKLTIGMEPWFGRFVTLNSNTNYPPYNVLDLGDGRKRLELALAGFSRTDVEVYTEKNLLTVSAKKEDKLDDNYHHQGLARRAFTRSWSISDDVRVDDVKFIDGLLIIDLSTIVPEHQRKKIYNIL